MARDAAKKKLRRLSQFEVSRSMSRRYASCTSAVACRVDSLRDPSSDRAIPSSST